MSKKKYILVQPKLFPTSPKHLGPTHNFFGSTEGEAIIWLTLKSRNKMAAERLKAHKQLSRYRKREGNEYFSFSCLYCKLSIFSSKMHQLILSTDIKSSLTSLSMSIFYWISFRSKGCYITRYLTSLGHDKNSWKLFFSNARFSLKCLSYSVHLYVISFEKAILVLYNKVYKS